MPLSPSSSTVAEELAGGFPWLRFGAALEAQYRSHYYGEQLGQSWVGSGRFGLVPYVGLLHGGVLLFALALIAIRHNRWALANLWRGRGMAA